MANISRISPEAPSPAVQKTKLLTDEQSLRIGLRQLDSEIKKAVESGEIKRFMKEHNGLMKEAMNMRRQGTFPDVFNEFGTFLWSVIVDYKTSDKKKTLVIEEFLEKHRHALKKINGKLPERQPLKSGPSTADIRSQTAKSNVGTSVIAPATRLGPSAPVSAHPAAKTKAIVPNNRAVAQSNRLMATPSSLSQKSGPKARTNANLKATPNASGKSIGMLAHEVAVDIMFQHPEYEHANFREPTHPQHRELLDALMESNNGNESGSVYEESESDPPISKRQSKSGSASCDRCSLLHLECIVNQKGRGTCQECSTQKKGCYRNGLLVSEARRKQKSNAQKSKPSVAASGAGAASAAKAGSGAGAASAARAGSGAGAASGARAASGAGMTGGAEPSARPSKKQKKAREESDSELKPPKKKSKVTHSVPKKGSKEIIELSSDIERHAPIAPNSAHGSASTVVSAATSGIGHAEPASVTGVASAISVPDTGVFARLPSGTTEPASVTPAALTSQVSNSSLPTGPARAPAPGPAPAPTILNPDDLSTHPYIALLVQQIHKLEVAINLMDTRLDVLQHSHTRLGSKVDQYHELAKTRQSRQSNVEKKLFQRINDVREDYALVIQRVAACEEHVRGIDNQLEDWNMASLDRSNDKSSNGCGSDDNVDSSGDKDSTTESKDKNNSDDNEAEEGHSDTDPDAEGEDDDSKSDTDMSLETNIHEPAGAASHIANPDLAENMIDPSATTAEASSENTVKSIAAVLEETADLAVKETSATSGVGNNSVLHNGEGTDVPPEPTATPPVLPMEI